MIPDDDDALKAQIRATVDQVLDHIGRLTDEEPMVAISSLFIAAACLARMMEMDKKRYRYGAELAWQSVMAAEVEEPQWGVH